MISLRGSPLRWHTKLKCEFISWIFPYIINLKDISKFIEKLDEIEGASGSHKKEAYDAHKMNKAEYLFLLQYLMYQHESALQDAQQDPLYNLLPVRDTFLLFCQGSQEDLLCLYLHLSPQG